MRIKNHTTLVINGEENNVQAEQVVPDFPTIYKVPNVLCIGSESRYEPLVASFGPYHHQKQLFEVTEDHKMSYVRNLIGRRAEAATLEILIAEIEKVKVEARACYAENFEVASAQINSNTVDKFVKMMVIDGCFLLELLYKYKEHEKLQTDLAAAATDTARKAAAEAVAAMCKKDPIFRARRIICSLRRDMVLIENQLPFTVLYRLFILTSDPKHNFPLAQLLGDFMAPIIPWAVANGSYDGEKSHHLLDLLRRYLIGTFVGNRAVGACKNQIFNKTSAVELRHHGVVIKSGKKESGPLDITFTSWDDTPEISSGGSGPFDITLTSLGDTLEIPRFIYGEGMTVLIPNIIALEQCHDDYSKYFSSYAILLGSLVNSKEDVKLLRQKNVIYPSHIEDEKVATGINNLCSGVQSGEFYYGQVCLQMNKYISHPIQVFRAFFISKYSNSINDPLIGIKILVVICTVTQTIFAVLAYHIARQFT